MNARKIIPLLITALTAALSLQAQPNDPRIEIYNLRNFTHPSYTRIVVDIGTIREYISRQLTSPDRIYVDIYQVKLNPLIQEHSTVVENGYIRQIRIAQRTQSTVRVVVDLDFSRIDRHIVWHLFDPFRIVIDIYPQKNLSASISGPERVESPPTASVGKPAQPSTAGYSLIRQLGLGIRRIVIDPGHGGNDPGCVGRKDFYEKAIVLDVSLRLKNLLSSNKNIEVIMTRETDIFLPPENRPVIANQQQADLFISIHANSNPSKSLSGVQTFFLNFSTDASVNSIAARENATSTKNISQMKDIIERIAANSKIVESRELANLIHSSLIANLSKKYSKVRNLGVRGGPFWVLIGGDMPSILVEISHLSNPMEEERMKDPRYRQAVAQGIYDGIMKYIISLGKG